MRCGLVHAPRGARRTRCQMWPAGVMASSPPAIAFGGMRIVALVRASLKHRLRLMLAFGALASAPKRAASRRLISSARVLAGINVDTLAARACASKWHGPQAINGMSAYKAPAHGFGLAQAIIKRLACGTSCRRRRRHQHWGYCCRPVPRHDPSSRL